MTEKAAVKVKYDTVEEKKNREAYYGKPDKVEFTTSKTWAGTKVFLKRHYSNGEIKQRLLKILKRDADIEPFISAYKKEMKK